MEEAGKTVKAHKAVYRAPQKAFVKAYRIDVYRLSAFAAWRLFNLCLYYRVIAQAPAEALMALGAMAAFIAYMHRFARKNDTAVRAVGGALLACDTAGRAAETLSQKLYKCPVGLGC